MKLSFTKSWTVILTLLALTFSAIGVTPAHAAGLVVNSLFDTTAYDGICTLREAITNANNNLATNADCFAGSGADTITFSVSGTITLASTLPNITDTAGLTMDGTGQTVTISGNNAVHVMQVGAGASLTLNNLTIANGTGSGGGIYNSGTATITNSTFSGNSAPGGFGAGIRNGSGGTLTVTNSTFSGNSATGGFGAGIRNDGNTLTITNSTFSGNSAIGGFGAGVSAFSGTLITNSTFSGNNATGGFGAGIYSSGLAGGVTLRNTILANSASGGNCGGAITNGGNNIDDGTTCGWVSASGSMSSTPPLLGALANNGGPTQTLALLTGSPAIDGVTSTPPNGAPSADQRGVARQQGVRYDIGAFESQAQAGPAFIVNANADTNDSSCDLLGQGIGNKDCTLREAINAANAPAGADTITFSVNGPILLGSTLPNVTAAGGALTIDGTGRTLTISGNNAVRVMQVVAGASLTLNNLTIANGFSGGLTGAGILNSGTLTITNSTFSGNSAGWGGSGGGVWTSGGALTITNSTFSGNSANGGFGGGINNNGPLTITNSTFSGNSAALGFGAGVFTSGGPLTITNSTFSGNSAPSGLGGGIWNNGVAGGVTLSNTILANSVGAGNCGGPITNGGNNLQFGGTVANSCGAGIPTADPQLGALTNNGGPTQTFALLTGSPAIDGVTSTPPNGAPLTDQRGVGRPQGVRYDIGAFELEAYTLTIISANGTVAKNLDQVTYHEGDVVQLTATPNAGWSFVNWTGGLTSSVNPDSVTIHGNTSVTANYTQNEYTLTITSAHGTVAKNLDQVTYHEGDVVQLTATPYAGWSFANWTGALTSSVNPGSVTIHGDTSVTANYTQNEYTLFLPLILR